MVECAQNTYSTRGQGDLESVDIEMARAPLRLINLIPHQPRPVETMRREPVQWVDTPEDADVAFCWPQDVSKIKSEHKHLLVVAVQVKTSTHPPSKSESHGESTATSEDFYQAEHCADVDFKSSLKGLKGRNTFGKK